MKLHFLHKELTTNIKFSVHQQKNFLKLWHYHPETELVYIAKGEGTLYVGDFIGNYRENDIFLLGKNVPHMFHSKPAEDGQTDSKAYVFHIQDQFLNSSLNNLPEFRFLENTVRISKRGALFRQKENEKLLQILDKPASNSPPENAIKIFQVLLQLSEYRQHTSLGSLHWLDRFKIADKRVNDVIEYIMLHFKEDIKLEKAAEISAMNKSAFCRYFKKSTGKPFVCFLNEIRINYSCKLLLENNPLKSISDAGYQSGFNSLSYYNRTFKKIMGVCPSQYYKNNTKGT